MKKYKDLYEKEKRRHEEALQRYQENHMDEMEIINLYKRCNKTKAATKTSAKAAPKVPRSGYPLFLKEQLDEMTGEDQKNYRSIVSKTWKDIKEDPARLTVYNDRASKMKNEAEKPTKLGDDSSVSRMEQHEKTMAERATVKKKIQRQSQKAPKSPKFVDTDSDDSDNEPKPAVKHPLKAPKTSGHDDKDPQKTSL